MAELLNRTDEEGYNIKYCFPEIEEIARNYRQFNRLQRRLEKKGFEEHVPHYAGTCWNDMELWADLIVSAKEEHGYSDSEPDFESEDESKEGSEDASKEGSEDESNEESEDESKEERLPKKAKLS